MIHKISILEFLEQSNNDLIVDVRSPQEFEQGHIPRAKNIALFTDDERAVVGTLYKEQGKQQAILQGLQVVGPKLASFVQAVENMAKNKTIYLYCARGGMRSSSFAWLLQTYGYEVYLLIGGYKTYRNFALTTFLKKLDLIVVSGQTGTGKTILLQKYAQENKQIIDLEGLAHHKGSVFGGIGLIQPTQEQFENELALQIHHLDSHQTTWIEDESRKVGNMIIPAGLWNQMRQAPMWFLEKTEQERVDLLMAEYGSLPTQDLAKSLLGIAKHLGSERHTQAQELLSKDDRIALCLLLIKYYDQAYEKSLINRKKNLPQNKSDN